MPDPREWLQLIAPIVGTFASRGGGADFAFMDAYQRSQAQIEAARQQRAEEAERKRLAGADFTLQMAERLAQQTDPMAFEGMLNLGRHAGQQAGYDVSGLDLIPFSDAKRLEADRKAAQALINDLVRTKGPEILDADVEVPWKGGSVPLDDLEALAGLMATDRGTGQAYTKPKPQKERVPAAAGSLEHHTEAYARRLGKPADQLTDAEIREAMKVYQQADDRPADPTLQTLRDLQVQIAQQNLQQKQSPEPSLMQVTEVDPDTGETVTRLVPKQAGEVSRRPPKDPTQGQFTAASYAARVQQSEDVLHPLERSIATMSPISFEAQRFINRPFAQSGTMQSYLQASRNFINAVLRRESGAAIAASEFVEAQQQYLPVPGDTQATLQQKRENRLTALQNLKNEAGRAFVPPVKLSEPPVPDAVSGASTTIGRFRVVVEP